MKTKAFTLVELLAVIIILGILTVIITPKIIKTLSEAKKNTNMTSAQNLAKSAGLKVSNNEMTGNNENIKINYQTGENTNYLDYTGEKPEIGQVHIRSNGKIAMAVKFGDYCYIKQYNSNDITVIPYNESTCGVNADVFINYTMPELATEGDGLYEAIGEPERYVYRGANPNNYIYLKEDGTNNTLYRIISYEPDDTIKVIRNDKLSANMAWDEANARKSDGTNNTYCTSENGCNVWGDQTNTLYNGSSLGDNFHYFYYSSPTATTLSNGGSGKVGTESTLNKYLNDGSWAGLSNLESYIDAHTWKVGGVYYATVEADDKGIAKEKEDEKQLTWTGKIGLMYITEYVDASLNPTCTSMHSNLGSLCSPSRCKQMNWIHKNYTQWSLSPNSSSRYSVWVADQTGCIGASNTKATFGVRPAFYLKSSIKLGGFGTIDEPYYIIES